MPNSRGEERRLSDMPGFQAVRVVLRSCPWSGTARAATPRTGSGSRVCPEPDRAEACVARRCGLAVLLSVRTKKTGVFLAGTRGRPCGSASQRASEAAPPLPDGQMAMGENSLPSRKAQNKPVYPSGGVFFGRSLGQNTTRMRI